MFAFGFAALALPAAAQAPGTIEAIESPSLTPSPTPAPGQAAGPTLAESLSGVAASDYRAGRILFDDGDYAGASLKFQHAYEESREPRLLWNVATCEKHLRHYAAVMSWLELYTRVAGASMPPARRAEVHDVLKTVRLLISTVRITVDQPGVAIFVDGVLVGNTPLPEPLRVDLGKRTFRLSKPGWKELGFVQEFAGGSEVTLNLVLQPADTTGQLSVFASAGDSIRIDGQLVGQKEWSGTLQAGDHELRVSAEGKQPQRKTVAVVAGEARSLFITLEAARFSLPAWVWIGAGVVVAGGLATGGYFLLRPPRELGPEPGTLGPPVPL